MGARDDAGAKRSPLPRIAQRSISVRVKDPTMRRDVGGAQRPIAALLFAVAACQASLTDPALPSGAVRFTPPGVYATWWAMTEQCSGTTGDMSDVSWYVVPGVDAILDGDITVVGYWSRISNRIVLAGAEQKDGGTIRHEMLHT